MSNNITKYAALKRPSTAGQTTKEVVGRPVHDPEDYLYYYGINDKGDALVSHHPTLPSKEIHERFSSANRNR